ncbi:hypothetical protein JCM21714_276 [Gracilibacillus boraciitolerans JCM 21714]|uniref:Uncharacterized protein n=1 Tax=Gracilibacillus boraciitolerans JCM 21714 TaxID=1298598 RepID=W4VEU0_9BACI|nr:hypothetical protein [Gracilibacillus boraciitolerans]GAE91328.1 hypothetical protein JCM21714_276 [Gracilibacillus boraciitolerans JCM 21714]
MTNHNDKEYLINQLKNMPKIEDQQSKEQLYQKIQRKLNHNQSVLSKKRVAVWIPTLASICSIILLFIIIQTQNFSNQSDQSSSNSAEDSSMESAKLENSDQTGESSIAEDQDESKSINNSQDTEAVEEESSQKLDQMYNYMINIKNESAVYTAFITEQAQHIVPVTLLNSKEETYSNYIEQIDGQINLDQNGLYDIGIKDMEFTIEEA